jgi:putative transposase
VIQIDERKIQGHPEEVVRSTVAETLNDLLGTDPDRACRAERFKRTEARKDTRAGPYPRHPQTNAGEVTLREPKLCTLPFDRGIIVRCRGREFSGRWVSGDPSCGNE